MSKIHCCSCLALAGVGAGAGRLSEATPSILDKNTSRGDMLQTRQPRHNTQKTTTTKTMRANEKLSRSICRHMRQIKAADARLTYFSANQYSETVCCLGIPCHRAMSKTATTFHSSSGVAFLANVYSAYSSVLAPPKPTLWICSVLS